MNKSAIYNHYSFVKSTPVGLWAHACNNTILPGVALFKQLYIPSKSQPLVSDLKYGYYRTFNFVSFIIPLWLPQVGLDT